MGDKVVSVEHSEQVWKECAQVKPRWRGVINQIDSSKTRGNKKYFVETPTSRRWMERLEFVRHIIQCEWSLHRNAYKNSLIWQRLHFKFKRFCPIISYISISIFFWNSILQNFIIIIIIWLILIITIIDQWFWLLI